MTFHINFRKNNKGIGTVFAMVFFLLIVMVVFASFVIILTQNTGLEQTTIQAKQLDLDRYSELQTVSIANPETAVLNNRAYILCDITNNGTLPTEFTRLWIRDITNNTVGNTSLSPSLVIQPGTSTEYFKSCNVLNASTYDQFSFWFVTTRGNLISAYPDINQFSNISTVGASSGQNSGFANNTTPIQLYVNPTKPNDLIYLAVAYDDGNTLNPPASTPYLNWANRTTSASTDRYSNGDAFLRTYYAFSPGGPINISLTVSGTENNDYYWAAVAFTISNVNVANPFDSSGPQTSIGSSSPAQDTIKISSSNELAIGAVEIDTLTPNITPGVGFTQVLNPQITVGANGDSDAYPRSVWVETSVISNPTNSLPVNCTYNAPGRPWAIVLDAVKLVATTPIVPASLSPSSGPTGQPVTVSGGGFAPNSHLIATFDGIQVPFSFSTDNFGNIQSGANFTVPIGSSAGNKTVTIIDTQFNYATANFIVTTPNITLTPKIGSVGTAVTVTGSNFIDNSTININFDGNPTATNPPIIAADANGGFSATFVVSGTVGNKTVLANDGVNSALSNFTVIPSISVTPTRGLNGTQVTLSGQGFAAQSTLQVAFDGNGVSLSGNPSTDSTGSFINLNFTAQSSTLGVKSINVRDASGNFDNDTFKLVTLDHFNMAGYPSSLTAGQSFGSNNVTITACDVDNYVLRGYVGQVYFSSSDNQALLPYTFSNIYNFTTDDNGVHTFAGSGFVFKTAGSEILTVTDGVKSNSTTIVVNFAVLDHFTFNNVNSPQVAGTAFSITITAKDAYENTVTSYVSSNGLTVSTGTINPTTTGNFASGTRTLSVTLTGVGSSVTIGTTGGAPVKSGTSNAFTVNPGAIHHFTMTGLPASVVAGQVFGNVVVTAYDINNNVKTDYAGQVYFTSTDGAAVLPYLSGSRYTFVSGDLGVHTFAGFTLKTVGSRTITVTDGSVSLTSSAITVNFAPVDHFAVTGFPDPVVAGTAGSVTVTAQDPYGNTVTTYVGTVHITSSDGAAVRPADHALASGVYTFTNGVTLKTTGDQIITATDVASGLITGSQTGITVNPGAISSFTIAGYPSSVAAGTSFGGVVVTAYDAFGNVKTDFVGTVYFTSSDGAAVLPYTSGSRYTFVSGDQGDHIFAGFTLKTVAGGAKTITVTDGTRSATSTGITVVPGAIDHFAFAGLPASVTAGSSFAGSVTVTAFDSSNNVKTDYVGSVYFTSSDAQAVLPFTVGAQYTFLSSENGVHAFAGSGFTLKTSPSQTITVRDDAASKSSTSGAITVNFAVLDHFTFNNVNSPQVAGTAFSITITAKDAYENTVTSYVSSNGLTVSTGTINPTTTGNFASGTRTLSVTLTGVGSSVTIGTTGGAPVKSGTSNAFTVNPGAIHHFTMTGLPASVVAGQVFGNVVVTAYDINNNVKTDYAGQVYFTSTDGAAVLPYLSGSRYTFVSGDLGVHTFAGFTLKTVGSRTITVTDGSVSLTSSAITVNFAPVDHFAVTGFPDPVVAGTAGSVTVTAQDPYGNTVTTYVGTVHITSSDGAAVRPADHALASGVYTFTNGVTLKTTGDQIITATDVASGLITGSQTGITVNPGAISSFTIAGYPSSVAAGTSFGGVVVTAYDAFGNVKTDFVGTVYFTSSDGAAVLPYTSGSRYTFVSGDQGDHIFAGFTLKTVAGGAKTITVTDGTRSATSTGITVVPGAIDHFAFAGLPASVTAGSSFAGSVTVTAFDSSNNVKTDYVGSVYFTSSDAQAVLPFTVGAQYTFLSSENGVHAFAGSGFTLKTSPSQTITVRDDAASKSSTSGAITVNFAVLDHFTFNNVNSPQVAGTAFSITITAKDAYENTVTSYVSSNGLTVSTGTINPTTTGNFASGTRTLSVTLTGVGSSVTIGTTGGAPVKSGTSNAFTVNPGAIHHFTMTGLPASVVAGQVFGNVVVTAYDINNNVKTDYAGQVYFTSTDGAAVLPYLSGSRYTFVSGDLGVHTFAGFTLKTVGSRTITVTDGSVSLTSSAITVNFAPVDHFAVTGFPDPVVAGTAGSVTVTAQDPYGNTVTTYVGTVHITSSDGAAVRPADHALASGVYTFTNGVTLKTTGDQIITATDVASGLITGSQTGITVNPGAISSFTIAGYPSSVAAGTSFGGVVVTAYDAFGNVKTDFVGTVYFTSSDGAAVLPYTSGSRYTFVSGDQGDHIFAGFTLKTVAGGAKTITVTDGTRSAVSSGILVTPAALASFTIGNPGTQQHGVAFLITLTAYDAYGNVKTDYSGSASLTDRTGTIAPITTSGGWLNGVWNHQVTIANSRTNCWIAVTDVSVTQQSSNFNVN